MIKFSAPEDRIVCISADRVTETENRLITFLLEDPAYTYILSEKLDVSRKNVGELIRSLKRKSISHRPLRKRMPT